MIAIRDSELIAPVLEALPLLFGMPLQDFE
jgi:hypothetical protein